MLQLAACEIEIAGDEMSDESSVSATEVSSTADAALILIWLSGSYPNDGGNLV